MENLKENKTKISGLFILVGIVTLIISVIDIADLLLPLNVKNPVWIFNAAQTVTNSLLAPAISITFLLAGIYFVENYSSKKSILVLEKLTGLVAFLLGILVCFGILFYSLSIKSYESSIVSSVKLQSDNLILKVDQIYNANKGKISQAVYNQNINEIKAKTVAQISQAKKFLLKKSIKLIIEMILYAILYFLIGIFSFKSAKNGLIKLKFFNK